MIQVENEIGMLEDARDHSPEANKLFSAEVPQDLKTISARTRKDCIRQC